MHRLCKTFITNHGTKECMQGSQYSAMYTEWRDKNDQRDWTDWTKFSWWQLLLKGSRKNGNETRIGWMHLGGWWDLSLYNTANGTKELDEERLGCTMIMTLLITHFLNTLSWWIWIHNRLDVITQHTCFIHSIHVHTIIILHFTHTYTPIKQYSF
jgi:hypothetical protein